MKYENPGKGSIEFAKSFIESKSKEDALRKVNQLLSGELHDKKDKKIKRCEYCHYYYRDQTRPNNSRTCSIECKIKRDTLKKAKRRADDVLLNPKKKENHYAYWLEYPFWTDERKMLSHSWKKEVPYSPEKLDLIIAARNRENNFGGKIKPKRDVPYNGDEIIEPKEVKKVLSKSRKVRKPGKVEIKNMEPKEISSYLTAKYSQKKLQYERKRARNFSRRQKGI
ncbi:hypothetical protein Q9251_08165 [Alkalihalobacillus macyae]|uniref:hypothetical protein n=1 Tax=Guptibacillus hwajinpoensis TaxID=208199 RepID=UPI00273C0A3E|nr:hypothetical protein [Alkalihalobacillus macyae]MDP4550857.1 hypothetical protein [Alkalihalobacillus macyae]